MIVKSNTIDMCVRAHILFLDLDYIVVDMLFVFLIDFIFVKKMWIMFCIGMNETLTYFNTLSEDMK